jgi:hypothetical protein
MSPKKLIAFDEETFNALTLLGRDRMATIQDLADEAFADVLRKHGRPVELREALKKSLRETNGRNGGKNSDKNGDRSNVVPLKPKAKGKR